MASVTTAAPTLERLPHVVLDIICGHLDDESGHRRDLCAFSLTSRRCCAAADTRRFGQIVLVVPSLDELDSILDRLNAVLGHGRRHGLVHRLKVQGTPREMEPWERNNTHDDDDKNDEDNDDARSITRNFDTPPFCRIGQRPHKYLGNGNRFDVNPWLPFASFIRELPALRDLVWFGSVPRCVLDALDSLHAAKRPCRLHLSGFRLRSLVYDRDNPRPIDPDEYALVTSPALYSIQGEVSRFDAVGALDYSPEVLQLMVAGLAPNLTNVWLDRLYYGASLYTDRSIALGRPNWRGFFLKGQTDQEKNIRCGAGSLENLRLGFYFEPHVFNAQNMANLRRLHVVWSLDTGQALANLAVGGQLPHLEMLSLMRVSSKSEPTQTAVNQIVSHTKPLRHLRLNGHFTMETFDLLTRQHGPELRSLMLNPNPGDDYEPDGNEDAAHALFAFSADALQVVADRCPHVEEVYVEMRRTRGDHREVAVYRALSKLPQLKRVVLRLACTMDFNDDDEHLSIESLKQVFSNCAMDESLARAIFGVVSPPGQGGVQYLRIEPQFAGPWLDLDVAFYSAFRVLARNWVCYRSSKSMPTDEPNGVVVREINTRETRQAVEECLAEDWNNSWLHDTDNYEAVFKALWPGIESPWHGWTSLALETGDGVSD